MRYSINGDFFRIMRITGPTHNLLGLAFSGGPSQGVTVERLAGSSGESIDEAALEEAVVSGVEEANNALGTAYRLRRIQYVSTDTPDMDIYSCLARLIVERLASGAKFDGTPPQNARGSRSMSGQVARVEQLSDGNMETYH